MFFHQFADGADDDLHDLYVLAFVVSAHIVDAAVFGITDDHVDGLAVVFHIEPVAHILSLAVNGQRFSCEDIVDDERNELLRELVRAVVV